VVIICVFDVALVLMRPTNADPDTALFVLMFSHPCRNTSMANNQLDVFLAERESDFIVYIIQLDLYTYEIIQIY
jgi:hypothetical protein